MIREIKPEPCSEYGVTLVLATRIGSEPLVLHSYEIHEQADILLEQPGAKLRPPYPPPHSSVFATYMLRSYWSFTLINPVLPTETMLWTDHAGFSQTCSLFHRWGNELQHQIFSRLYSYHIIFFVFINLFTFSEMVQTTRSCTVVQTIFTNTFHIFGDDVVDYEELMMMMMMCADYNCSDYSFNQPCLLWTMKSLWW